MALNALRTEMVTFTGTPGIEVNGVTVGYKAEYSFRTGTEAKYNAIEGRTSDVATEANHKGQYYIQLGEQLYDGKLRLANSTDPFGRPSRDWEFNGKTIGVYAKRELIRGEYTKKVTGKDLYDLLTKPTIEDKDYDFYIYVDGEDRYNAIDGVNGVNEVFNTTQMNKNNKAGVGGTGKGVLTEVYVDSDKKEVTIAIINTYLARAKTDYNEKQDEVTFNVYGIDRGTDSEGTVYFWKNVNRNSDQKEPITVYGEDFAIANVQENDAYLVTVAEGEIQTMVPSEILSGVTLSAFGQDDFVVTDGTQYDYAVTAQYDVEVLDEYTGSSATNLKDLKYNVYLDKYGYLIGVDLVDDANNYVFITGVDSKTSNLAAKNYDANAIFLDGTMKTITFNTEKSNLRTTSVVARNTKTANDWALANTWCTYTVNSDGVYTLTQVALPATVAGSANDADSKSVNYGKGDSTVGLRTSSGNSITKIGQYWDHHDDGVTPADGKDSASEEINVKRVSLRGSEGTSNVRNDFKFVYGNKNTVYLNTEVKGIYTGTAATAPRGVISKVTSVTTGVENANLEVLTSAEAAAQAQKKSSAGTVSPAAVDTAYGSYVLYGRDGYVIAAVTVARDASATENLVYVDSSSVKREEDNGGSAKASGDGMWTWYRDAIKDGERVTLTEVGDGLSILKSLVKNNWYVISYNAEGEVIGATHAIDDPDVSKNYTADDKTLEKTMVDAGSKTVLYERAKYGVTADTNTGCSTAHDPKDIKSNKGPVLKGNTFYSETDDKTGFFVDDSVKVVIIQTNRNESTTQFLSGMSALENVVAKLNKENDLNNDGCGSDYHYEVSAIIENGRGKVVIINDLHKTGDSGNYDVTGAYELRLYGSLFTADDKTTGKSDAVVSANGGEIKATRTGRDAYGNYTVYSVKAGDRVAITDYDIDSSFQMGTNLYDLETILNKDFDVRQRISARSITFLMPGYDYVWIEGREDALKEVIYADVQDSGKTLDNINVKFDGSNEDGDSLGQKQVGDKVTLTFANKPALRAVTLDEGQTYTVTVGAYKTKIAGAVKDGVLAINYSLTAQDIYNGEVTVWKIEEGDTTSTKPTEPVDPSKPIKTVAITGVTLPVKVGDKLTDPTVKITGVDVTAKWQAATAAEKNTLTITVKAQEGYTLDANYTVTVNGKNAVKGSGDTWTFEATAKKDEDPAAKGDLPKATSSNASDPLATGATLTVAWYTNDSTKTQPTAAEIKDKIKADLGADLVVNVSSGSAGSAMSADGSKTYTLNLVQQRKVTLDDEFLAYIKSGDSSAKVVMPSKTGTYINAEIDTAKLTVNASTGEYAIGSKTADTALYSAIELAAGATLGLDNNVYVKVKDAVQGTKYDPVNTNKFVKIGSELRVVPDASANAWSYLTKNGTALADPVYNNALTNYDITVAANDVGSDGKLTFDQFVGYKVMVGESDLGIVGNTAGAMTVKVTSNDVIKTNDILIVDDKDNRLVVDTAADRANVTYTGTESGQEWTLTFGSGFDKATAAGDDGIINLIKAKDVDVVASTMTAKVGATGTDIANGSNNNLLAAVGATVIVTSKDTGAEAGDKITATINNVAVTGAPGAAGTPGKAGTLSYTITGNETHAVTFALLKKVGNLTIKNDSTVAASGSLAINFASETGLGSKSYSVATLGTAGTVYAGDTAITVTVAPAAEYYFPDDITVTGVTVTVGNVVVTVVEDSVDVVDGNLVFKISFTVA